MIGGGAALLGAGYLIGRKHTENNKNTAQKILDKIDKALD